MALTFPTAPADGATYVLGGITFTYTAASDSWLGAVTTGALTLPAGTVNGQTIHWNGTAWLPETDVARNFIDAGTAAPTTRTDTQPLAEGDVYYNTTDDKLYAYDGLVWNAIGGSKWTDVGVGNIYRNSKVAVGGASDPLATIDVQAGSATHSVITTTGAMDLSLGQMFTATITAATSFSITNAPAGRGTTVVLHVTNGGSQTITWPAYIKWMSATAPALTAAGTDVLVFVTPDGGATWRGSIFGTDIR